MTAYTGYFLIADISGYTAFLTSSEQDHASPILRSLLSSLVEQIGEPLHLWRMDGDAVLAYTTKNEFPTGETFLGICENLYNTFATLRQNIVANTTCTCKACANVAELDLKIMVHYGDFEEMQIGPMTDISGAEVILVHRMAKTDVKAVTGINSYALISDSAAKAMDIDAALVPYSQTFEHFGEVGMQVYDLAEAWGKFRATKERFFLTEEEGVFTYRHNFDLPVPVLWDALVAPELKVKWMQQMLAVDVDRPDGRIGPGSGYHCAHSDMDFYYWVTDWEPFDYFSTIINAPFNEKLKSRETYQITATDTGTSVRYTMGPLLDEDGKHYPTEEQMVIDFLAAFWPPSFNELSLLMQSRG